jgi:hypothetical protein
MKKYIVITLCLISNFGFPALAQTYIAQVKSLETGNWGYVDQQGNMIIPAKYGKCHEFSSNGLAPVYSTKGGEHYYFINTKNEILKTEVNFRLLSTAMGYDILSYHDGYVPVKVGKKCGYMDTQGKLAIAAKYDDVLEFNDGFGVGRTGKTFVVINEQGEEFAVPFASTVRHFSENLAPYQDSNTGLFGFIGTDGKVVIPAAYEGVGYFSDGLAWARSKKGKIGFINSTGEMIIKPQFDLVLNFNPESGVARFKMDDAWGYVNKEGKINYVKDADIWGDFGNGLAPGRKNGKFGFYNFEGNWVIEPTFDHAREFKNGYAAVRVNKKWGFIDTSGNWVIKPTFDAAKDMELINE